MIDQIKSKIDELEGKKKQLKPKIDEIEEKRTQEIAEVNKKFDHMVYEVSIEVENYEKNIMNDIIDLFSKLVMEEFDAKRSVSDYIITEKFKDFRDNIDEIELFPKELISRLDKVLDGNPIENLVYDLEKIENKYKIK